jgi:peptidoglycan-associated lipoprotein
MTSKSIRTLTTRVVAIALVLPFLAAGKCKPEPPPPPPPPPPQEIKVAVQVTSLSPSKVKPDAATSATLLGAGFKTGATVQFGNVDGNKVQVADENTIKLWVPALPEGTYDVVVTNPDGANSTLRGGLTVKSSIDACRFTSVGFAFDSSTLSNTGKSNLQGKLGCYQEANGAVKVEGHADERGTVDYNLALGQRRADAVKRFLTTSGVSGSRITTVSFGEEKPVDPGHSESAWSKNRRADVHAFE